MRRYCRVLGHLFRISQAGTLEYRVDFWLTWLGDIFAAVFTVVLFSVIYGRTGSIAGWSKAEVFLIIAGANYLEAFIYFLYVEGIRSIPRLLPLGDLDTRLTKPVDFQFFMTFANIYPASLGPIVPGILLTIVGVASLSVDNLGLKLLIFGLLLAVGLAIHYSMNIFFVSYSFVVTRIRDLQWLDGGLRDLGAKPIDIYPKYLKYLFFTIVPIVFFANVPAEVFRPAFSYWWVLYAVAFGAFSLWASRKFFYFCLTKYNSASS